MTEIDLVGIRKKLAGMIKRINRLSAFRSLSLTEYLEDEDRQAAIERYLELVIQAAIDINKMLLGQVANVKLKRNSNSMTNSEAFLLAGEHGLISQELATQLADSGKFRNVLAHIYDDILPQKAYEALQNSVDQYPQYIKQIDTLLNSLEDRNEF